jgi:hypothetical protein
MYYLFLQDEAPETGPMIIQSVKNSPGNSDEEEEEDKEEDKEIPPSKQPLKPRPPQPKEER